MKVPKFLRTARQDAIGVLPKLIALSVLVLLGNANAQTIDSSTPIVALACNVFNMLSGPAAFLIALIVIVVGGVAIAVGGKRVIGGVVWGIVGVGIAISASSIVGAIMPAGIERFCGVT